MYFQLLWCEYWAAGLTSDTRQTRRPVRDTGESSADVSQDAVDVIFHPNQQAAVSHCCPGEQKVRGRVSISEDPKISDLNFEQEL